MTPESTPGPTRDDIGFREDPERPGAWQVTSDGVRQSYVDLADPTHLAFDYARAMAVVLDTLPPGPLSVVHVGGAACTLPRYVQATRPGSDQLVLEPDLALTQLVLERLPLPGGSRVRIEETDGRSGIAGLSPGSVDVVIVDALAAGRVPAELTTVEFLDLVARALRAGGVLLLDVVSAPDSPYAARVLAGLADRFATPAAIGFPTILRGMRFGNLVAVGADGLDLAGAERAALELSSPQLLLDGDDLAALVGEAAPLTDATAEPSPEPPRQVYRSTSR